jgi:hypothetical protein
VLGQRERERAGAGVQRGGQRQGICVETTPKEFCSYVGVGVVSWTGGHPGVHAAQRGAPAHPGYVATRVSAGLRRGLDGTPSAVPAPSSGWVVRGFVVELL